MKRNDINFAIFHTSTPALQGDYKYAAVVHGSKVEEIEPNVLQFAACRSQNKFDDVSFALNADDNDTLSEIAFFPFVSNVK